MTVDTDVTGSAYVLGTASREYERVRRQAQLWWRATERVLDRVDPPPGARCLDAGSGPGVTMRQLAQRVGPEGRVVGVDADELLGVLSIDRLHADGHLQCEFHAHDLLADTPVPGAPYDVVYARLVLFHLPQRVAVLRRLWDAVAPGGHLVVQDYDLSAVGAAPAVPAVDGLMRLLLDAFTVVGCEVRTGSLLPRLFEQAGIGSPDATDVAGRLDPLRDAAWLLEETIRSLLPAAIGHRLVTESDAHAQLARLHDEIIADPEHPVLMPLLLGAWKRKDR